MTNTAMAAKRAGLAAGLLAAAVMCGLGIGELGGLGIGDAAAGTPAPKPRPTHITVYPDDPTTPPTSGTKPPPTHITVYRVAPDIGTTSTGSATEADG